MSHIALVTVTSPGRGWVQGTVDLMRGAFQGVFRRHPDSGLRQQCLAAGMDAARRDCKALSLAPNGLAWRESAVLRVGHADDVLRFVQRMLLRRQPLTA